MDLGLKDVPVAVAGASKGLGYAVALELAKEGARVAICSRDSERIKAAASSIEKETGAQVHPIVADVARAEGAEGFVSEAATALGGLQVLVANAGGPNPATASNATDQEWLEALDLNFLSAVRMVRTSLPFLKAATFGRIVCITSISVKQPMSNLVFSNAVRSATTSFAKTLSLEVGLDNITVNCVLPGQIATDRLRYLSGAPADAGPDHSAFKGMAAQIPMGRIGTPEEFGAVVTFLCSKRASFVNGVAIQVDGGYFKGLL